MRTGNSNTGVRYFCAGRYRLYCGKYFPDYTGYGYSTQISGDCASYYGVAAPILLKLFSKSKVFDRLLVRERLTTEDGYVAGRKEQAAYIGRYGTAATTLRPAGTVELDDGTRIDVVTAGEFIQKGEAVQVVRKDGSWLIVEKRRTQE